MVRTVTRTATHTVTASQTASTATQTASTATPTTATTTQSASSPGGPQPALNGTYTLNANPAADSYLPTNTHDGLGNADLKWIVLSGVCAGQQCQLKLRRILSDSTLETLTLTSTSPTGVYTGVIPGGDGTASCGGRIRLSMIVRVGGLQNIGGQTIATMLAGHIFGDYACPGMAPTHDVATYTGVRS